MGSKLYIKGELLANWEFQEVVLDDQVKIVFQYLD